MAKNRYGRIYHSDYSYIDLRFPSVEARREFAEKFEAYHDSHDHDGEVPRFENINASEANKDAVKDVDSITIDGYYAHEIEDYHEDKHGGRWVNYKPPTCCVAPIISIDRTFVQSDTLTRHELSAIFTDIPDEEFASMLQSIQKDGFMDPVIRLIGTEVLDGWHRYSAAKELNLLRKLRFQQWNEKDEGDPQAFVLARNIERRHLSAGQRAQIVVHFNERFGIGDNQHTKEGRPNGRPKTQKELAVQANVGERTIRRAVAVEKEAPDESKAVRSGEKTAGEVIKARDAARLKKHKKQILKNMWDSRIQAARDYTGDSDTDLNQYLSLEDLEKGFAEHNESFADAFTSGMKRIDTAGSFKNLQDRAFEVDEHGNAKVDVEDLEKESKAISFYAGDIRQWQRPDWSPDTNWILPLIEAKKVARGHIAPRPEPKPEPDLKELREQVKAEMPKWKQRYKESGKEESELVSRASFSALIHVLRNWENASSTSPEEGAATAEELEKLLKHLKGDSYPFIFRLRAYISETKQPESDASDTDLSMDDRMERCRADLLEVWQLPEVSSWEGLEINLYAEEYDLDADVIEGMQKEIAAEHPKPTAPTDADDAIDVAIETWKTEKYAYLPHLSAATKPMFIDAAKRWHGLSRDADIAEEKVLGLLSSDAQTFRRWVEQQVSGVDIFQPEPEPEPEADTSLTEIDNLPAVKNFLENLNSQVETDIDRIQRDDLSIAIHDIFLSDGDVYVTERQQLAILIDVAHSILVESDSTRF